MPAKEMRLWTERAADRAVTCQLRWVKTASHWCRFEELVRVILSSGDDRGMALVFGVTVAVLTLCNMGRVSGKGNAPHTL